MSHSNVGIRLHNNQPDYDTTHMKKATDLVWEQKWLLCATNNCLPQLVWTLVREIREPLWQCFCSFPTVQLSKPDSNSLIWHSGCHITWKHCVVWDRHNISKSDNLPDYGATVSNSNLWIQVQLRLPVFFCLHLEGILQPVQQLVGELTNILLLSEAQIRVNK